MRPNTGPGSLRQKTRSRSIHKKDKHRHRKSAPANVAEALLRETGAAESGADTHDIW